MHFGEVIALESPDPAAIKWHLITLKREGE